MYNIFSVNNDGVFPDGHIFCQDSDQGLIVFHIIFRPS